MAYSVQIYDANQNFKATLRSLAVFDNTNHTFLSYSQQLSHWGTAKFRVATKDPIFQDAALGDLVKPWANHVKILKGNTVVWRGVIVRNPRRTKYFVDVEARSYEYLLDKILVTHDENDAKYPEDFNNFLHLDSGTIAAGITTILSQAKTSAGTGSFINSITAGTITNPNFPPGLKDINGNDVSGKPWDLAALPIKFNYNSVYYVLNALGAYSQSDFNIDSNLKLNFQPLIGTNNTGVTLTYGLTGQVDDYNIPYDGTQQVNELIGLAADDGGKVLSSSQPDNASITKYGKLQGVAAFADVKSQSYLDKRTVEQLKLVSDTPQEVQLMLNDRAFPLGQWTVGDIVTVIINDKINQFNAPRQVVRYEVDVKYTGEEQIKLITNVPPVVN